MRQIPKWVVERSIRRTLFVGVSLVVRVLWSLDHGLDLFQVS